MAAETMVSTPERPSFWTKVFEARRYIFIGLIIIILVSAITLIGSSDTDPAKIIASFIAFGFYPKPILDLVNPTVQQTMTHVGVTDPAPASASGSAK